MWAGLHWTNHQQSVHLYQKVCFMKTTLPQSGKFNHGEQSLLTFQKFNNPLIKCLLNMFRIFFMYGSFLHSQNTNTMMSTRSHKHSVHVVSWVSQDCYFKKVCGNIKEFTNNLAFEIKVAHWRPFLHTLLCAQQKTVWSRLSSLHFCHPTDLQVNNSQTKQLINYIFKQLSNHFTLQVVFDKNHKGHRLWYIICLFINLYLTNWLSISLKLSL
jgi:hypothetical protein